MADLIIKRYIQSTVHEALAQERVELDELSKVYLVDMLVDYSDANLMGSPGQGMPVLTWLYRDASEAKGAQRVLALRRLGDQSLFMSGFFVDYVKQTVNGLGYYIDMGSAAYGDAHRVTSNHVFDELSHKFVPVVNALNNVAAKSFLSHGVELNELFDLYIRDMSNESLQRKITGKSSLSIIRAMGSC